MRARVSTRALDRWRLTLPLVLPTLGGLVYLYAFGAPARLMAVNAGALAAALAWIMLARLPTRPAALLAIGGAGVLGLGLPLLLGPEVEGVSRWLPAGPIMLHSGALLLPLVTVIAARARLGPAMLALAGTALALQPDAAALAAVAAASTVLAWGQRSAAFATVAIGAAMLGVLTFGAGTLAPQLYTEGVLAHVAAHSLAGAIALGLLLFGAPLWYLAIRPVALPSETVPLAALLIGFGVMASIAPFPFPLIGYGASPILGFGLALGALAEQRETGFLTAR